MRTCSILREGNSNHINIFPCKLFIANNLLKTFHMLNFCFLGYLFREADMRTVSEKTNGRVAWFSIMSLAMCIAVFWFAIMVFEAVILEEEAYID